MITSTEIGLLRLVAQRVAGPGLSTATDAAAWLTAVQAQDLPGALTSVALRTDGGTRDHVVAALGNGTVVRSWPMRGTLHLVAAADLPWMLDLLGGRALARAARRRATLELDDNVIARAREAAQVALSGGRRLLRGELMSAWEAAGVATGGQRGYHLLGHLSEAQVLCFGPMRGGEQEIVLIEEWIPRPRRLPREQALGELAERFFRSHGPATVHDLARWSGLTVTDVRAGVAAVRDRLAAVTVDGVEHLLDPHTPERLAAHRADAEGVFLLPGFDEIVLGYADRSAMLPAEHADRIVPGGNAVYQPTVINNGRIVGTWRRTGRGEVRTLAATPFDTFTEEVAAALPRVHAALP